MATAKRKTKKKEDDIICHELPAIMLRNFLSPRGFSVVGCDGMEDEDLDDDEAIGILIGNSGRKKHKKRWFHHLGKSRKEFMGVIFWGVNPWTDDCDMQNWVFELYGRKNIDLAKKLIREMTSTFRVKITLYLTKEEPDVEVRRCDYDY